MIRLFAAIFFLVSALGTGLVPTGAYAGSDVPAAGFFSGIEDFSLMPGLTELPDTTLIFDSPSGRFVEAYATGRVTSAEIERFYSASLPQLGWGPAAGSSYQREGEVLEIEVVGRAANDGTRTVRFAISPAGNAPAGN
jgi:hypothetical protein